MWPRKGGGGRRPVQKHVHVVLHNAAIGRRAVAMVVRVFVQLDLLPVRFFKKKTNSPCCFASSIPFRFRGVFVRSIHGAHPWPSAFAGHRTRRCEKDWLPSANDSTGTDVATGPICLCDSLAAGSDRSSTATALQFVTDGMATGWGIFLKKLGKKNRVESNRKRIFALWTIDGESVWKTS